MLSRVTPRALLSCARRGATPGKLVQRRSMRGSGGSPGVSSGGSQTSNHTASNPPAGCSTLHQEKKKGRKKEDHLPPGTPPPITPAIDTLASRSLVCCSGSISTPESRPISRILLRICYIRIKRATRTPTPYTKFFFNSRYESGEGGQKG